jgi:hypothetical protein
MRRDIRSAILAILFAAALASAQTHTRPVHFLNTEDATVAVDGNGICWLSFIVKGPQAAELAIKLKVVRPIAKAPGSGLPVPVLGPGESGSWIWIGEGKQKGKAALFTLDAFDHLTWVALTPRDAMKYLPVSGGSGVAGS